MKFKITIVPLLGIFPNVVRIAAISEKKEASATFNLPSSPIGWDPNRFIVKMDGDVETLGKRQGAIMSKPFGHGTLTVMEFSNAKNARRFKTKANKQKYQYGQDYPIFPVGGHIRGGIDTTGRILQEEIPWGIENVFEKDGAPGGFEIPGPEYLPDITHKICIIDSGYQLDHPDLVTTAENADVSQASDFSTDICGHGSHVAGTILATDNEEGVIGVFPGAPSLIVKVFSGSNCDWSYTSSLIAATEHCEDRGAKIISMSLGGPFNSQQEDTAFTQLFNDGVLSIAAAGNAGDSSYSYPASYSSVMSVGAIDVNNNIAGFSQFNDQVDISGPGVGVKSTVGSGYSTYSGTSMATPHVAGVAFLLWNKYPLCSNVEIREALEASATDLGDPGRDDKYGHGAAKYWKAVDYLTNIKCSTLAPTISSFPSASPSLSLQPSITSNPTAQCVVFTVTVTTDNYGGETTWELKDSNLSILASAGPFGNGITSSSEKCLPLGSYSFIIKDLFGDGICCGYGNGSYKLELGGNVLKEGGQFGSEEVTNFDVVDSPQPPQPSPTMSPVAPPTMSPVAPPTLSPVAPPTTPPTLSPTTLPTLSPSMLPTLSPTKTPTSSPSGSSGCSTFELQLTTDNYGSETTWSLASGSQTILTGGPYGNQQIESVSECIPDGSYLFTINDSYGDGICCSYGNGSYMLKVNDVTFKNGGQFTSEEVTAFDVPLPPKECTDFEVEVMTDNYPSETSWELKNSRGDLVLRANQFTSALTMYKEHACILPDEYSFTIFDAYGDGICCQYGSGYYNLRLDATQIHSGGAFSSKETVNFTALLSGTVEVRTTVQTMGRTIPNAGKKKKNIISPMTEKKDNKKK